MPESYVIDLVRRRPLIAIQTRGVGEQGLTLPRQANDDRVWLVRPNRSASGS